jgi:putative peptidoglycan lipid II flippase
MPGRSLGRRMGAAALLMTASVLLSRVIGYLRDAIIAARHGATASTDVYFASFTLPDLMNHFLAGGALTITFVPIFTRYLAEDREEDGWRAFSLVATTLGVLLVAFTILGEVFTEPLVRLIVPGFNPAQVAETVRLTRIVLPAQVAFIVGGLVQATILSRESFGALALAPLIYNGGIIAGGLLLEPWVGIAGFSWGALIGAWCGSLLLPVWLQRHRLRFRFHFHLTDPRFVEFVRLSLPIVLGFSLVSVDEWILRYYASGMESGTISWLNNARRLMLVPISVFGQAAGAAALPFLTRLWAEGRYDELREALGKALRVVTLLSLAASAWLGVLALPVVRLFFERGAYTPDDSFMTAAVLAVFCLGVVAWSVQAIAARAFYARKDTLTPMLVSSLVVLLSLPVYRYLGGLAGVVGLAGATSLCMIVTAGATLAALKRGSSVFAWGPYAGSLLRSAGAAGLAGAVTWGAARLASQALPQEGWAALALNLSALTGVFVVAWLAGARLLRIPEAAELLARLTVRLR